MALRLRIVSEHARRLGPLATKVFGVHGGSIGRATDNEWALPDPERYLSGRHARVDFRAGTYFIVDCSSNGTYINGAQIPLGKSNDRELSDGDYLRLGEYELLVSIDASNDFPPDDSAIVAYDGISPSSSVKKSTADDIGANLDLSELLESSTEGSVSAELPVHDAYGQAANPASEPAPWHMMTRPIKIERSAAAEARLAEPLASPPTRPKSNAFFDADIDSGLAAICRGAGIDPGIIAPETRAVALQLCGRLLREVAVGMLDLAQSRNEFRNRFRITAPPSADADANYFTRGVDQALKRLLTTTTTRGGSVDAIRESFQELKAQQAATLTAMHTAFEEFLGRLDPAELSERFERGAKRGVFGSKDKARYWELYTELFNTLAQRPEQGFPHLFVETFARAFEQKLAELPPLKRGAFGADREDTGTAEDRAPGDS